MATRAKIENLIYRLKNNLDKDVIDDVNRLFFSFPDEINTDIDVILILGSSSINRAKKGLEVYKKTFKPIVVSGGVKRFGFISEAIKFREYLLDNGVKSEDIYIENMSSNTYENLKNSFNLINNIDKNMKNILIVTSSQHMLRVIFTFKKLVEENDYFFRAFTGPSFDDILRKDNWFLNEKSVDIIIGELERIIRYNLVWFINTV